MGSGSETETETEFSRSRDSLQKGFPGRHFIISVNPIKKLLKVGRADIDTVYNRLTYLQND